MIVIFTVTWVCWIIAWPSGLCRTDRRCALADGAKLYPGLERERLARAEPHVDAAAALLVRDHHPALMPG